MGWRVALFAAFSDCDFPKNEAVEFAVGDGSLQKESAAFDWHYLLDERYVESQYLPVPQILASLLGIERATVLLWPPLVRFHTRLQIALYEALDEKAEDEAR